MLKSEFSKHRSVTDPDKIEELRGKYNVLSAIRGLSNYLVYTVKSYFPRRELVDSRKDIYAEDSEEEEGKK